MRFRRGATLDPGQVEDTRGRGGGIALGGGGLGLAGLVIYLLVTLLFGGGGLGQLGPLDDQRIGRGDTPGEVSQACRTGEDANTRTDCRIVAVVNSVQKCWDGVFQRSNRQYQYVDTVFFTGQVQTGCGLASSQVGPFYCPADKLVYIDLGFFDDLQSRFGVGAAPFTQAYGSRTNTATMSRTSSASSRASAATARGRRARPCGASSRPTAMRGSGQRMQSRPG